jgi:periplasmic protein TonB
MTAQAIHPPGYGAAELKACADRTMTAGAAGSTLLMLTAALLTLVVLNVVRDFPGPPRIREVVEWRDIQPPRLAPHPPTTVEVAPPRIASPRTGIVVPTPDEQARPEATLATPRELARGQEDHATGDPDRIVISRPPEDDVPQDSQWRYYEDEPQVTASVAPAYPEIARQAGIEGTVTLRVLVGEDGRVRQAVVVDGVAVLNEAAIRAALQYRFKPALAAGRPVAVWVVLPFRFRLNGS